MRQSDACIWRRKLKWNESYYCWLRAEQCLNDVQGQLIVVSEFLSGIRQVLWEKPWSSIRKATISCVLQYLMRLMYVYSEGSQPFSRFRKKTSLRRRKKEIEEEKRGVIWLFLFCVYNFCRKILFFFSLHNLNCPPIYYISMTKNKAEKSMTFKLDKTRKNEYFIVR